MKVIICCNNCGSQELLQQKETNVNKFICNKCGIIIDLNNQFGFELIKNGDISDGSHTFEELYFHRMVLFATICNVYKEHAWKSWKHDDGTMFDDYFIVGVNTPEGSYSYHYHKDYWDYFKVLELPNAPIWDGHKPSDVERVLSLNDSVINN